MQHGGSGFPILLLDGFGKGEGAALHECMAMLGHKRFGVVGHDRGSYRAFRLAMNFPKSVSGLRGPQPRRLAIREELVALVLLCAK